MKQEKSHLCHGGRLSYYSHHSAETKTSMRFTLFMPPQVTGPVPYIIFLSGLTCTEENFTVKAGAYKYATELGVAVIAPDTSPRGPGVPNDDAYDLGQGAGFYLDATQDPWSANFRMESYLINDLMPQAEKEFALSSDNKSIMGHSMGGHGALTLFFRHKGLFKSCSAFSPIVAPSQVPWGEKAFTAYLGSDRAEWFKHDACHLVRNDTSASQNAPILIDQGQGDEFLDPQLKPHLFQEACEAAGQKLTLRLQPGYDHSYFFIQSFIQDHLKWHKDLQVALDR